MLEIALTLPAHEGNAESMICYHCAGEMKPATVNQKYIWHGAEVTVYGIKAHKCAACGEVILSNEEAKRIENALCTVMLPKINKPLS